MCEACRYDKPKESAPEQKAPVLHIIRKGREFNVRKGQIAVAMAGATLFVWSGGTGIFKSGSHGEVYAGGNFTAEDGSNVTAMYAAAGRALGGSTIVKHYGASVASDEGAIVHEVAAGESREPPGFKRVSYAQLEDDVKALMELARESSKKAYYPHSKEYPVGAAVLSENAAGDRLTFWGCNIENASGYVCAERTAIFAAVKNGYRKILKVAVFCPKDPGGQQCPFCKAFLREFGIDGEVFNLFNEEGNVVRYTVRQLLRVPKGAAGEKLPDEQACRSWLQLELSKDALCAVVPGLFAEIAPYWDELWDNGSFRAALLDRARLQPPTVTYDDLHTVWDIAASHGMHPERAENLLWVLSPPKRS